ncbi:hypothetical protein T02_3825 [Trichinella nativa]|uniref:Uncharacterized protein n=1 Tax=Trichinella nativa TaxID=6335 RepID=A0A0V1LFU6_9BILA|nr:hypothetical protein T02_3825 [Trichinella nativa]
MHTVDCTQLTGRMYVSAFARISREVFVRALAAVQLFHFFAVVLYCFLFEKEEEYAGGKIFLSASEKAETDGEQCNNQ